MLEVKGLRTLFDIGRGKSVTAVDGVSFDIKPGEVVGLVGESGSGKSVTALSIMGLLASNARVESGEILWEGRDVLNFSSKELRALRGKEIGLIFQNPLAALNPVFTIGNQMVETIQCHFPYDFKRSKDLALSWLKKVNIPDPEARFNQYPHECSLGMCQRIMMAITLLMNPRLLIADEPTASLDVTIQAQILHLLAELKDDLNMAVLMVSHDMGVVAQHCDRVMVMYLGKIVEEGPTELVFSDPKHPYTKALIRAIPAPDPSKKNIFEPLLGDIPSPLNIPLGCSFHPRCSEKLLECEAQSPLMKEVQGCQVSCHLFK
jgi:oligopeptide/dipeptide ABC transporter ATP-binding protein